MGYGDYNRVSRAYEVDLLSQKGLQVGNLSGLGFMSGTWRAWNPNSSYSLGLLL